MVSKLKEARLKAKYTIDEVSENLKIRRQYIVDLEEENFANMPGKIYVRGYLRMYCKFLGIEMPSDIPKIPKKHRRKISIEQFNNKYIILFSTILLIVAVIFYIKLRSLHIDSYKEFPFETNSLLENDSIKNTMDGNEDHKTPDN